MLKDNLFVTIISIIEAASKDLLQSDSNIFIDKDVGLMPSLSNWRLNIKQNNPRFSKIFARKYD